MTTVFLTITWQHWKNFSKFALLSMVVMIIGGCTSPVGINRLDIQESYQQNTISALSSGQSSEASKMVLRRHGLMDRFEAEPAQVLAELHSSLKNSGDESQLFALSELSLLYGQKTNDPAYFLASAVYAWALLFPEDKALRLKASDPRFRLAYDLYNYGLVQGLADAEPGEDDEMVVKLQSGDYKLPFGTLHITLDKAGLLWSGYHLERFVSTNSMQIWGLRNRYRVPGLGAALAASIAKGPASGNVLGSNRIAPRMKVPISAILRFDRLRSQLHSGNLNGLLEVFAADQARSVTIDGQPQVIESDPTAAIAYQMNNSPMYMMELTGFLGSSLFSGAIPKDRTQDGLFTLYPYQPGKIPIVLVHGTASSPARWVEMINELEGDRRIRSKYQIWVFFYDSGNPVPYSAGRLRNALVNAINEFDPEGKDPGLHNMVVIGHSQGGLLTKLTAVDSGNRLWELVSDKPFNEIQVSAETHELLERSLFFKPLSFVKRVVFISTPHHGAILAAKQWITGLAAKMVTLPQTMLRGIAQAATATGDEKLTAILRRPPTSIDNMNPNNKGLQLLSSLKISPDITAHSIIAVDGDGPIQEGDDGVVAYQSAHIEEAKSEKVVRWNHSCQGQPEVIEEVRRILMEHLREQQIP